MSIMDFRRAIESDMDIAKQLAFDITERAYGYIIKDLKKGNEIWPETDTTRFAMFNSDPRLEDGWEPEPGSKPRIFVNKEKKLCGAVHASTTVASEKEARALTACLNKGRIIYENETPIIEPYVDEEKQDIEPISVEIMNKMFNYNLDRLCREFLQEKNCFGPTGLLVEDMFERKTNIILEELAQYSNPLAEKWLEPINNSKVMKDRCLWLFKIAGFHGVFCLKYDEIDLD